MKKFSETNLPQLGQRVVVNDGVHKGKTGFVYSITQRYESGPLVAIDTFASIADYTRGWHVVDSSKNEGCFSVDGTFTNWDEHTPDSFMAQLTMTEKQFVKLCKETKRVDYLNRALITEISYEEFCTQVSLGLIPAKQLPELKPHYRYFYYDGR